MVTSGVEHGRLGPDDGCRGALWWRLPGDPWTCLSSASVGGGLGPASWVLNVGVVKDYRRTDLDAHAAEVGARVPTSGPGTALFTAADVTRVQDAACDGVRVWTTVGVTRPTWPADAAALPGAGRRLPPGTINTVVLLPVGLSASALVQAALVVAEAKAQACVEAGLAGTGTASDAVVLACPPGPVAEEFGGPRSVWGARVGLAVHDGVAAGLAAWPGPDLDGER